MKQWQIENSEKSEISEISEKLFGVFFFPSFRFCPTAKIQNTDLKISEKNFRNFRDFQGQKVKRRNSHKNVNEDLSNMGV